VHSVREADYTLKSTEQLLGFLSGENLEARVLSAHILGGRRAVESLAPLRAVLEDPTQDNNLRHDAALALGRICAPPRASGVDVDRAIGALIKALEDGDEYLPCSIAQALAEIGDARAVGPLSEFMGDNSRPLHAREDAARALGRINGERARP